MNRNQIKASQDPQPGMGSELTGIVFKTKENQVAEFLRERILSGLFQRGQKLRQAEIAKMFNLSITPVREALKLLEAEGYVLGASHRGAIVAPVNLEQVEELYELRLELETRLAREAFKRITPEGIESLIRMNEEMTVALKANDMVAHRRSNFRLHFRFYEMADQPSTLHFVRILWAKYPFEMLSVMPNRLADVIDEHQKFLDALKSGDGKAVIRAVQAHIESGHRKFKKHYAAELGKVQK
jgi:DNA-binding GntR family transcriptional regulator